MDNESEVAYVRAVMDNLPTLVRSSVLDRRQAPKRGRSLGHTIHWCVVSTPKETRCKAHILTSHKNGRAERWNPPTALSATREGGQAVCLGGQDGSRSEGSAVIAEIC